MLQQASSSASGTNGSDNVGFGLFSDLVSLLVWTCVMIAVLIALIGLLYAIGRRRAAERASGS